MPDDEPFLFDVYTRGAPNAPLHPKGGPPTPEGVARIYLDMIRFELSRGTKFYHAETNEPLTTAKQIGKCLLAGNEVRYEAGAKPPLLLDFISGLGQHSAV